MSVSVSMIRLIKANTEHKILLPAACNELVDALLEDYDDIARYNVLADWFAEHDEPEISYALRWMVAWDKRPHYSVNHNDGRLMFRWMWLRYDIKTHALPFSFGTLHQSGVLRAKVLPTASDQTLYSGPTFLQAVVWLAETITAIQDSIKVPQ